uniref:Uncharacterized protein n=1 Tax=Ditylenchus dipsaci TaxID=166011 RepID=A0A915EBS5_9BILA
MKDLDIALVLEDIYAVVKKESMGMAEPEKVVQPVLFGVGYAGLLATLSWASSFYLNDFLAIHSITNTYDAELINTFTKTFGCKESAIIDALRTLQNYNPARYFELADIFGTSRRELDASAEVKELADFCAQTIRDIASINYPFVVNRFGRDVPNIQLR